MSLGVIRRKAVRPKSSGVRSLNIASLRSALEEVYRSTISIPRLVARVKISSTLALNSGVEHPLPFS